MLGNSVRNLPLGYKLISRVSGSKLFFKDTVKCFYHCICRINFPKAGNCILNFLQR